MWFDLFEAEDMRETVDVRTIDTGSTLKFEVCTACHGYFLDAGELKDMDNVTAVESLMENIVAKAKTFGEAFKSMHYKQN